MLRHREGLRSTSHRRVSTRTPLWVYQTRERVSRSHPFKAPAQWIVHIACMESSLRFDGTRLNFTGVDYPTRTHRKCPFLEHQRMVGTRIVGLRAVHHKPKSHSRAARPTAPDRGRLWKSYHCRQLQQLPKCSCRQ